MEQYKVFASATGGVPRKTAADTRWALTWKMADGQKTADARLVATGYEYPDLRDGAAETSGLVSQRSSRFQVISLSALKKW